MRKAEQRKLTPKKRIPVKGGACKPVYLFLFKAACCGAFISAMKRRSAPGL